MIVAVPLLLRSFRAYRRGSVRGGLLLAGALSFFLYNGASMAFSATYNDLFLVYTALMSSSLFAFVTLLAGFDTNQLEAMAGGGMPRKGIAVYFFVAGSAVLVLWGMEIVAALLSGEPPANLGPDTTPVTHAFDMGVIAPTAYLSAVLLLKRRPNAYRIGFPIIILNILIGMCVISQTVMQTRLGIVFSMGQMIGIVGSWVLLAGFAVWSAVSMWRNLKEPAGA
jgi:hypothetical protein